MSNKEDDSQQGGKEGKKISATDDLAESLNATSIVDHSTATNTSSSDDVDDDDDGLFDPPPPKEDCAHCLISLPNELEQMTYHPCCGNIFCSGCSLKNFAVLWWTNEKRFVKDPPQPPLEPTCPFCRADLFVSDKIILQRFQKRMALDDPWAFNEMATSYDIGSYGLPKDKGKAMELYLRSAELGSAQACWNIACQYDEEGALGHNPATYTKYLKKAAKRGHVKARHNLGVVECKAGNFDLAGNHCIISAVAGDYESLKGVGLAYHNKIASKNQYKKALRGYQKAKKETSSDERKMAKKSRAGRDDLTLSVFCESELAGLCGVRKAESALFSQVYRSLGM